MRHGSLLCLMAAAILLGACQPPVAEEPTAETPPVDTAEPPTPTSVPPSATPAPSATPTASSDLLPELSPKRYFAPVEGCDFLPPEVGERVIGPLAQPVWTEPVYLGADPRLMVACSYPGEENSLTVKVWIAPTLDEAQADYSMALAYAGDEAVRVDGLGDTAFWWPRALRLEVLHRNARLWITFGRLLDDSADSAAMLAAAALPLIDPSLDPISPPAVDVPADAPMAEIVTIDQLLVDGEFEPCSLVAEEEFEALIGPLGEPPLNGGSVGEMVGYFYDCYASTPTGSANYSLFIANSTSSAIDRFQQDTGSADQAPAPLEGLGDDAAIATDGYSYNVYVLRGNIVGYFLVGMEDTPENQERAVEFVRLVIDRLFERAAQSGGS